MKNRSHAIESDTNSGTSSFRDLSATRHKHMFNIRPYNICTNRVLEQGL